MPPARRAGTAGRTHRLIRPVALVFGAFGDPPPDGLLLCRASAPCESTQAASCAPGCRRRSAARSGWHRGCPARSACRSRRGLTASSRRSSRIPTIRELSSGPWHRKHVPDMIGRTSRLNRIRAASEPLVAGACPAAITQAVDAANIRAALASTRSRRPDLARVCILITGPRSAREDSQAPRAMLAGDLTASQLTNNTESSVFQLFAA